MPQQGLPISAYRCSPRVVLLSRSSVLIVVLVNVSRKDLVSANTPKLVVLHATIWRGGPSSEVDGTYTPSMSFLCISSGVLKVTFSQRSVWPLLSGSIAMVIALSSIR